MTAPVSLVHDPGPNEVIRRHLNVPDGNPGSTVAPELFAVVPAMPWTRDMDFLVKWRRMGSSGSAIGGATTAVTEVLNPPNSGQIAIIEDITVYTPGACFINIRPSGVTIGGLVSQTTADFDSRQQLPALPGFLSQIGVNTGTTAILPANLHRAGIRELSNPVGTAYPFVLAPNSSILIVASGAGVNFDWQVRWIQRTAQPAELR